MAGFYGILLIVALVAVSGVIAYVGDILGRRMGRKRLSLFGMRPRHTAITISVFAGMLITLFTLAAAMLVSRDVKDGFLRVDDMRRRQTQLSREVEALDQRIAELETARRTAESQLKERKAELEAANRARQETLAELEETKAELTRAKADLGRTRRELAAASEQAEKMQGVLTRLSRTLVEMQDRVGALRATATRATQEYVLERSIPILFGAQQPLEVELVAGGQPEASARRELEAVLARVAVKVREAGARPLAGSDDVVIVSSPVRDPESSRVAVAGPEQVLEAVAASIHESSGDVIVRVYSVFNTHVGEPVYVDFQLFRNALVFRQGEVLAETLIDGRLSQPALMGALVSLLRDEVGAKARAENVMPRVQPGGAGLFGSTAGAVGEITYDDLFGVIERVRGARGPARVRALAAEDTWTIGPLKVDLQVEAVAVATAR